MVVLYAECWPIGKAARKDRVGARRDEGGGRASRSVIGACGRRWPQRAAQPVGRGSRASRCRVHQVSARRQVSSPTAAGRSCVDIRVEA